MAEDSLDGLQPVEAIPTDEPGEAPAEGIALCLSGGGYRAMLFHIGSLWRLNELGYLKKLARVSSVSGGSITAGVLGLKWKRLGFNASGIGTCFESEVVAPVRALATHTLDAWDVLKGLLGPGSAGDFIANSYKEHLFGDATLQDLPADPPRFIINASNVQSGALWRFSRPYMADYRVGRIERPTLPLAAAVAASSAFPPFLSPVTLKLDPNTYAPLTTEDLQHAPYTSDVVLTDGGVYDNLGLETAWKRYQTVLVSDGGAAFEPEPKPSHDWLRHTYRVLNMLYNDVSNLRKRQVIGSLQAKIRTGTYWGIRTNIANYRLPSALACPFDRTSVLAAVPTRLEAIEPGLQERLINWGYAVCDAAMRTHVCPDAPLPSGFPYADAGL